MNIAISRQLVAPAIEARVQDYLVNGKEENNMRIFISGPYTKGDVAVNVRNSIHAADYVSRLGHFPYNPLMTHFWHMLIPHEYEFWIAQDEEWLKSCDAILRLEGESAGADKEVALASELGLIVYGSVFDIPKAELE